MASEQINENVRYEPEDQPSLGVTVGAGIQAALSIVAGIVLGVVIIVRIADAGEGYMGWAVFAALFVSGATTILQAVRVWRVGSGHVLMMGTSGAFIAVCVAALVEGGPGTMASLVVVSSLFQFLLAFRLSWLRRVLTPVVSGTVIMLIAATVMPILFDTMTTVPDNVTDAAGPVSAAVTAIVVVGVAMRGPVMLRIWAPIIGIVVGCAASAPFGLYDFQPVLGRPLGRRALPRMARLRLHAQRHLLRVAARLHSGDRGRRDRNDRRLGSHSSAYPAAGRAPPTSA